MKIKTLALAVILPLAAACSSGVDKEATADQAVKDLAAVLADSGITLDKTAESCIHDVVVELSDDEIKALSDGSFAQTAEVNPELVAKATEDIQNCILPLLPTP